MARNIQNSGFLKLVLIALTLAGCTRGDGKSTRISVSLPAAHVSNKAGAISQAANSSLSSKWQLPDASLSSDLNCYAIAIEPVNQPALQTNSCYNANGDYVVRPSMIYGGFPAGTTQQIDVAAGPNRKIYLIGFKGDTAALCKDVNSSQYGLDPVHFSAPVILDSVVKNFEPGQTVEVNMTVPGTLPAGGKFEDCTPYQFGRQASANALAVTSISPIGGPVAGGTAVVIYGTGFDAMTTVSIGGSACTSVVPTPTMISCTTSAHASGPANVVVTRGAMSATLTAGYAYTAPGPAVLTIGPVSYNFGSVPVGTPTYQLFQIQNTGGSAATGIATMAFGAGYQFSGGAWPGTAMGGDCPANTIPAGTTCYVAVEFNPVSAMTYNDNLFIDYNNGTSNVDVSAGISGTGVFTTMLQISDGPGYTFSATVVGATTTHNFTLSNPGPGSASSIGAPYITGGAVAWYSVQNSTCGTTLANGSTCSFDVVFQPLGSGGSGVMINVDFNNGISNVTTDRNANGVGLAPALLQFSPSSYTFPVLGFGQTQDYTFTITNSGGNTATSITNNSISGPYSWKGGSFPGTGGTCGGTLAAGASCTAIVTFAPGGSGNFPNSGSISYFDGATGQIASTALDGYGDMTSPTITLTSPYGLNGLTTDFFPIDVTASEPISGMDPSDVQVSNGGVVLGLTGSGANYTVLVYMPNSSPTFTVSMPASMITDLVGNPNAASNTLNFTSFTPPPGQTSAMSVAVNVPTARSNSTATWAGAQLFIFGGRTAGSPVNGGGFYDVVNNSWQPILDLGNQPSPRDFATSGYDGKRIVVWGGNSASPTNTGGIYSTSTNTWTSTSITGSEPAPRYKHTMVMWATRALVWGGLGTGNTPLNSGSVLDTLGNTWATITTTGAPSARTEHAAVTAHNKMLIWGGGDGATNFYNTGGIYNIPSNSWSAITTTGAPSARANFAYVWTGSKLIVWGGMGAGNVPLGDGKMYDPTTDTWYPLANGGAPSPRYGMQAAWTGTHMVISGGYTANGATPEQFALDPVTGNWTRLKSMMWGPRVDHTAAFGANRLIVFGGYDGNSDTNSGTVTRVSVPGSPRIQEIVMGDSHACAIGEGGKLKCWGNNNYGQLGMGDTTSRGSAASQMGVNLIPVNLGVGLSAMKVAVGDGFTCALLDNFSVKCWGVNNYGQLGQADTTNRGGSPADMAALNSIGFAGQRVIDVSAGSAHACAVTEFGQVKCWGLGANYRLGNGSASNYTTPATVSGISAGARQVLAGDLHSCALLDNGIQCWGDGALGQIGNGNWTQQTTPDVVSGFNNIPTPSITGRGSSMCADQAGTWFCWGENTYGQLGDGSTTNRNIPVAVAFTPVNNLTSVSAGGWNTCGINNGFITCWGDQTYGALGTNSGTSLTSPGATVIPPTFASSAQPIGVSSGWKSTCAWFDNGTAACWGQNDFGRLGQENSAGPIGLGSPLMSTLSPVQLF